MKQLRAQQLIPLVTFVLFALTSYAQTGQIQGTVRSSNGPVPFITVHVSNTSYSALTDSLGQYHFTKLPFGEHTVTASGANYEKVTKKIILHAQASIGRVDFMLNEASVLLDQVVISATMKPVSKSESPVPVEVYSPSFFKANPTPSIYEAMQNVNGVRPQVNCAVCNTGDIHINGLEGAYTMILIDGMPIVSGLSTVYGLSGIPQSLIERVEIVKGPASTLYGSEAVGGLINVITKKTTNAPKVAADVFTTSWGEVNTDVASKFQIGKNIESLLGVNYFNFSQRIDKNNDNFTDLTLQDRISIFNKWNVKRKSNKIFTLAGRYVYEDRFGGDLVWNSSIDRGKNTIYGESIYTSRWELFGTYQLPMKENVFFQFSANEHDQNSVYGETLYIADQKIGFGQMTWNKEIGQHHDFMLGTTIRYTYYDDNTPATAEWNANSNNIINKPTHTFLPGIFIQDEISLKKQHKLLLGMRYDYHSIHGNIYTPRANYKWSSKNKKNILRIGAGTGYRVANVFTEDHAALTGSRTVVFLSDLHPETSVNGNLNFVKKMFTKNNWFIGIDASLFYTYFENKIVADYDLDPSLIVYDNLDGHAISNGLSVNFDVSHSGFKLIAGITVMDVYSVQNGIKERQELTEQYTATWSASYNFKKIGLLVNYTGNLYGPMELPTQDSPSFDDPRPSESPWWSIQNIQLTKKIGKQLECYGGVKNILNWTPWKNMEAPLLGNTLDPFETNTPPDVLVFDPAYVYAPNQGIRGFFGLRYTLK